MRAIDVNGRLKYITWITFRFLDNLTSINYGGKFEKFFCKIGLPELELEKENETSLEDFFYSLESLSKKWKKLLIICDRNIKYYQGCFNW